MNRCWLSVVALLLCILVAVPARAQGELYGADRDKARASIIYPVVFDPVLALPLTPGPSAVIDAHGGDVAATAHIAARAGDDSYGILASAPVGTGDSSTTVDPRGLRRHASLGFHLTNIVWHPKSETSVPWALFIHADYRFNRAEYDFVDAQTHQARTDTRLNDTASMLVGAQLFSTREHPGYFVGVSYIYSAVFQGLPDALPQKIRGNLLRVEMRHPFAKRLGINPSVTYDNSSGVTTVEGVGYVRARKGYAGLRLGNESTHDGRGGFFATAFVGWEGSPR
jgi:hypothetical protein